MILFEEDYKTHRYIFDHMTKNVSFIKMSVMLKRMGVKNNKFMLVLTQPELQGLDPYSKDLTNDQILKITYECKTNPWYFFREILRIPAGGGDAVPYQLNRANLALIWLFMTNTDTFLTMPRQIGKTIGTIGLITYMMFVIGRKLSIGLFAKGAKLRQENVTRLKELRNGLPNYLFKKGSNYNTDNQEGLRYKVFDNEYKTFVAQSDKRTAAAQGRGESFAFEHWDEMGYYTNNDLSYESAIAATDTASEQVRSNGIPCANIITTTAGRLSDPAGKYAYGMKNDAMRFTETFYDVGNAKELKGILDVGSQNGYMYVEFSYKQLGKSAEWFKKVTRGKSPEVIALDYENKWIHGAGGSIVAKEIMDMLKDHSIEPITTSFVESMFLKWYVEPSVMKTARFKERPFIIGSDVSDNIGADWTTLVMVDPIDMSVVMTCRCNQSNVAYIAKCITNLLKEYGNSIFIPERNRSGGMLIDFVLHSFEGDYTFDPFQRIFNTITQDWTGDKPIPSTLDIADPSVRKTFGFKTTSSKASRELLYSAVLSTVTQTKADRIFDKSIVDEICGLTVKGGRIDHSAGMNDDTLIAYLIACYFVMFGKNHDLYGISSEDILSSDDVGGSEDPLERERQKRMRNRIDQLDRILDGTVSPMLRMTFDRERRELKSMISESTDANVISIHQVKKEARKEAPTTMSGFEALNVIRSMDWSA